LNDSQRILGLDPGLNVTGYAVVERSLTGPVLREAGIVRSRRSDPLSWRLREIHSGIRDVMASLEPTVMAIEELYSHYNRPRTAILMGHARGAICLAAAEANVGVVSYAATQVKKLLTGNGRASKSQMQSAIQRELRLPSAPQPHDVADALALALCHYYRNARQAKIIAS
jgi:crossover junction endodeoxyribonuclease RuvC